MLDQPNLPLNDDKIIGRKEEIEEIASHLKSQSTRIVGVYGPPGSGKSEVVIAVAHNLKFEKRAVYLIDLTDVETEDVLVSRILRFFSDQSLGPLQPVDFLLKQFSLIKDSVSPYFILDNADSLMKNNRFFKVIEQILRTCERVKILVGTRELIDSRILKPLGQRSVRVGPLAFGFAQKLVKNRFAAGCDRDSRKVAEFCGRMPFAIRLFCDNMPQNELSLSQAIDHFISLIKSDISKLENQDEQGEEKLYAILESSYQILSPENRKCFLSLSVIPGLFHEKAAAAVWGISTDDAQRTLESLQRKSLIDYCYESRSYKVHNLFRLFAMQKGAREMNEVVAWANTRFIQFYISLFAELNHRFLSAQSMSAFIDFYEDKHKIILSLKSGCLDFSTRDSCFDALTKGMLFLDTVLWSDRVSFDEIYNTAITEAKQLKEFASYSQLILAKAFSEVTWGTQEVEIKQLYGNTNELLPCDSDEQEGKRLCFLGIHKLANAQIDDGIKHLKDSLTHFNKINDPQLNILRIVTVQILELYYESENPKEECETGEQQGLLIIPNNRGGNKKSKDKKMGNKENRPLELEIYFLLTKATKIFSSSRTMELFQPEINKMKSELEEKCTDPVENSKIGSLYLHCFVVGVLAEMTRYEEAIKSIQAAIAAQEKIISVAEDNKESHKEALVRSYSYLAVLQFRFQDYSSSLKSQERAMDIKREILGEQHPDVVDSYHEFAIILRTIGDCDQALQLQQRVLEIRLNFAKENHLKLAASYHELGVTQCKIKNYSSALRSHESALKRLEKLGEKHRDTANSYHELGVTQWFLGKYQDALDSHQNALGILRDVMGEHHIATADSYHEIGKTYFCLEDYRAALRSHLHAFRLRLEVLGEQHPDTANSCFEIGVTQFQMGWYAPALQYHSRAISMRQAMHDNSPNPEVAQSFYHLGLVQCQMENFEEAVNSLNRALSIRKGLKQEQDIETADIYYELGKAFIHKEDYTSAIEMHQLALGIRKSKMGEAHASVADSLFQLGLVEWKHERYQESLQLHQKAADIKEKFFGKKHHRTAESYFQLGLMFSQLKCYNEALKLHQQALEIWQELLGYMHTSLADSYLETGCALINVGQVGSAFSLLENALTIRTQIVAKEDRKVANLPHETKVKELLLQDYQSSLQLYKRVSRIIHDHYSSVRSEKNSLKKVLGRFESQLIEKANCYFDIGDEEFRRDKLNAALHAHQRALNLRVTLLGENHRDTASSFVSKGKVHFEMMDYTQALDSHQRALDIRREILGDNHPHTADSYTNIGHAQDELGHYTLALQSHKRALEIRRETIGENHLDTAISYTNIGKTHQKLGSYDSALQSYQQALKTIREKFGDNHPHTAECYDMIGNAQSSLGDHSLGLQSQKRALKINFEILGREHLSTASTYNNIGITHHHLGNYTLALQSYQRALKIYRKQLGENHLKTASTYNNIGVTQRELGDYASAIQSLQKALEVMQERLGDNHPYTAISNGNLETTLTVLEDEQGHATDFNLNQPVLRKRHARLMPGNPDKAVSHNDSQSGITEESLGRHASLPLSLQRAQVRREIAEKKHSESSTTSDEFGFIKCALVILLILMILSYGILPGFSRSAKRYF